MSVVLNGCVIAYSYDRLSKKCRKCMNKEYCSEKYKEKQGVLAPFQPTPLEAPVELNGLVKLGQTAANSGVSVRDATDAWIQAMECLNHAKAERGQIKQEADYDK